MLLQGVNLALRQLSAWVVTASLLLGCSSKLAVYAIDYGTLTSKQHVAAGCRAERVEDPAQVSSDCIAVGDVFVGDTGRSIDCGAERVLDVLELEACKLGGETALVREVEDRIASCYQARAVVFHCP